MVNILWALAKFWFFDRTPTVGFIAEAFNLRWSFALIALFGALITWLVNELKKEEKEKARLIN